MTEFAAARRQLRTFSRTQSCNITASTTAVTVAQDTSTVVTLAISRENYRGPVVVAVNGLPDGVTATVSAINKTSLTATVTISASPIAATVTNDAFTITATTPFGVQTINATCTVILGAGAGVPPTLVSITPISGPADTPTAITLSGFNFRAGAAVTVGGSAATSVVLVNANTITCLTPSLANGQYDVVVSQDSGTSTRANAYSSGATLLAAFSATNDGFTTKNGIRLSSQANFYRSDLISWDGTHSYKGEQGKTGPGQNPSAELEFEGLPSLEEVYIAFRLYQVGEGNPTLGLPVGVSTGNDKLLRVWYDRPAAQFEMNMGCSSWTVTGGAEIKAEFQRQNSTTPTDRWNMGLGGAVTPPDVGTGFSFWGVPAYQNRWTHFRFRVKPASAANNDGIFQMWVDGVLRINRTKINNHLYPPYDVFSKFNSGYILGSWNSFTPEGQNIYFDDIRFSVGGFA